MEQTQQAFNPFLVIDRRFNRIEQLLEKIVEKQQSKEEFKNQDAKKILTRNEASNELFISLPTLDQLIKSGQIPSFNIGRQVRIKRSDLDAYLIKKGAIKQ